MRILSCCVALGALELGAQAQNIDIDFEPVGSPAGTAPTSYAGPAQSPGVWNPVTALNTTALLSTAGIPSAAALTVNTVPQYTWFEVHDYAAPPDEALLDDYLRADLNGYELSFTGLAPGNYAVYTISVQSGNMWPTQISVLGSPDPDLYVDGVWSGSYVIGSTGFGGAGNYARHTKNVTDGTLHVFVYVQGFVDQCIVQGVQLVRLDPDVLVQCPGDGTLAPCPCANSGQSGRGCDNSAATGGAELDFSGNTTPDTLVLHATGMLPSASAIFLQGTANVGPLPFGDGLRCAGGLLKRLYLKSASASAASAPQPGDLSITQRSAALGDPIPIGDRRYYQVYYRDPSPSFCPAPSGATYNITNSLRVFW